MERGLMNCNSWTILFIDYVKVFATTLKEFLAKYGVTLSAILVIKFDIFNSDMVQSDVRNHFKGKTPDGKDTSTNNLIPLYGMAGLKETTKSGQSHPHQMQ